MPGGYQPVIQVIDNFARNHRIGTVFEAKVGEGSLLVNGYDLRNLRQKPEAAQLHASLLEYLSSKAFRPDTTLTTTALDELFTRAAPAADEPQSR